MKAKAYLQQIRKIDSVIKNKEAEAIQWHNIAYGLTPPSCGERVQSSGSKEKMADAVINLVDITNDIREYNRAQYEKKKEIIEMIQQLELTEYDLLHKVYVQYIPLEEYAEREGKSYSWATHVHGNALKNLQRLLDGKDKG